MGVVFALIGCVLLVGGNHFIYYGQFQRSDCPNGCGDGFGAAHKSFRGCTQRDQLKNQAVWMNIIPKLAIFKNTVVKGLYEPFIKSVRIETVLITSASLIAALAFLASGLGLLFFNIGDGNGHRGRGHLGTLWS